MISFANLLTIAGDLAKIPHLQTNYTTDERLISRNTVFEMIEECISTFEAASQEIYDRFSSRVLTLLIPCLRRDWISAGSERSFSDHDPPRTQDLMKHPPVLWAYVSLKHLLQVANVSASLIFFQCCRENMSSLEGHPKNTLFHELFITSETLFRLLKAVNQSPNTSLAFCLYDLCAEILIRSVFPRNSAHRVLVSITRLGDWSAC
jgi:hypothetical protein